MRLFLVTFLMIAFCPAMVALCPVEAVAQTSSEKEGRTVYKRKKSNFGAKFYNSPSGGSYVGGPIALNQLLQGNNAAADGSRRFTYTDNRAFGSKNFSLSLSPEQVRASRARQEAAYQREQAEFARLERQAEQQKARQNQTNPFVNQFQSSGVRTVPVRAAPRRVAPERNERGFKVPKKVFNSIR